MSSLILIAWIILLAAISPGPDFVVVMKNATSHGRKAGLYTTCGVVLGLLVHVTYCVLGLGVIITQSILAFQIIKIAGAVYLLYLAYKLLMSPKTTSVEATTPINQQKPKTPFAYIREGFLVNLLNPKATVFILSLFTTAISSSAAPFVKYIVGAEIVIITGLRFCCMSYGINTSYIQKRIHSLKYYIEKVMGWVLALLAVKVLIDR